MSVDRLVLFFPDVYRFSDSPFHPVAFSVNHYGVIAVYVVVQRDGVVCDFRLVFLCCCGFTGALCVRLADQGSDTHQERTKEGVLSTYTHL